jgi:hypothetical protein
MMHGNRYRPAAPWFVYIPCLPCPGLAARCLFVGKARRPPSVPSYKPVQLSVVDRASTNQIACSPASDPSIHHFASARSDCFFSLSLSLPLLPALQVTFPRMSELDVRRSAESAPSSGISALDSGGGCEQQARQASDSCMLHALHRSNCVSVSPSCSHLQLEGWGEVNKAPVLALQAPCAEVQHWVCYCRIVFTFLCVDSVRRCLSWVSKRGRCSSVHLSAGVSRARGWSDIGNLRGSRALQHQHRGGGGSEAGV